MRPRGESGFTTLHANVQTRLIYDAAAWFSNVAGTELLPVRRHWLAEFENMSGTSVTSPSVTFDSGRDASEFLRANGHHDLAAFPYTCGAAALAHGEQLEAFGVVEREPAVHVELGYDSSRNVEPILLPAGGGTQTITVTITPRGERFRDWSWISIFIDAGSEDEVRSLSGPANLGEGETLIPMDRGWTLVEGVLGKTYSFEAVIFYANDPGSPVRHWPGMQIYAFEQQQGCDVCASPGRVEVPVAALDGPEAGSGMVTVAVDEPVNILASTKSAYVTVYDRLRQEFGDCWNDVPGSGRNIVELPGDAPTDGVVNPANGHLYRVIKAEWHDAEAQAQALGGHLVALNDAAEEEWVRDTFGRYEYFGIGFNDMALEGDFKWTSGEPATYTNWCEWEPNDANDGEDIAIINWCCQPPLPVVTNTNDSGPGSLRAAIHLANARPGPDTITFAIPSTDAGFEPAGHPGGPRWFTIRPLSPLPSLTDDGTTIDGFSQAAFSGETNPGGPEIYLEGSLQPHGQAFNIQSHANTIAGLAIGGFPYQAILIQKWPDPSRNPEPLVGNVIRGNYIGTTPSFKGFEDRNGARYIDPLPGISVIGGVNTIIGGPSERDRNVISGNAREGIDLGGGTTGTLVQGNWIGTSGGGGSTAVGNQSHGIHIGHYIAPANGNVVRRNVISGNKGHGIQLVAVSDNVIEGNLIGTNGFGDSSIGNAGPMGNALDGIHLRHADRNRIGGTTAEARNVISANGGSGIRVVFGADNVIQGNFIGTDAAGLASDRDEVCIWTGCWRDRLGNGLSGLYVVNAGSTLIGGTVAGSGNVISGNAFDPAVKKPQGVRLEEAVGVVVQGNRIGTDATGMRALPNRGNGIGLWNVTDSLIGGPIGAARNVVSANGLAGVVLSGSSSRNLIQGNYIGTDATGTNGLGGHGRAGIEIGAVRNNIIGGTAPGSGNVISGNGGAGVLMGDPEAGGNVIQGNPIFGNGGLGIDLGNDGVTPNDSGDTDVGANGLQNFPVLYMAVPAGRNVLVRGFIDSPNPSTITVELFGNDEADPSGYGEGQRFVGTVTPRANGCFTVLIDAAGAGRYVTATATDAAGNTSEFSAATAVRSGRPSAPPRCAGGN